MCAWSIVFIISIFIFVNSGFLLLKFQQNVFFLEMCPFHRLFILLAYSLYQSPRTIMSIYHKLGGLKQKKRNLSHSVGQTCKIKVSAGPHSPQRLQGSPSQGSLRVSLSFFLKSKKHFLSCLFFWLPLVNQLAYSLGLCSQGATISSQAHNKIFIIFKIIISLKLPYPVSSKILCLGQSFRALCFSCGVSFPVGKISEAGTVAHLSRNNPPPL